MNFSTRFLQPYLQHPEKALELCRQVASVFVLLLASLTLNLALLLFCLSQGILVLR